MEEIGLFPLGIVLLPTELVPLHVFEERYKELVGECLEHGREFGLVYADDDGVRETGTRARVAEVLERFDDGRLDIVVVGGERFHVERLTRGRSFLTAEVQPVDDRWDEPDPVAALRAVEAFRALAAVAGAETDEPDAASPALSFELAARVEIVARGEAAAARAALGVRAARARHRPARHRARGDPRRPPSRRAREDERQASVAREAPLLALGNGTARAGERGLRRALHFFDWRWSRRDACPGAARRGCARSGRRPQAACSRAGQAVRPDPSLVDRAPIRGGATALAPQRH